MRRKLSGITKLNKQTPTHTIDWYIKWVASIIIIISVILTSNNIYPLNLFFYSAGLSGWFIVALLWNDRALLVVNAVSLSLLLNGLISYYVK
jgi:energy-coupling factor transporter transmembrane protein EcfT|tara:strand:- start:1268 stop:1543 length:276 start_codon:yes stop_codon:yes gene_type:complete